MKALFSYIGNLTKTSFVHGLIMSMGGSIATGVADAFGTKPIHLPTAQSLLIGAIGVGAFYIAKNMKVGSGTPQA